MEKKLLHLLGRLATIKDKFKNNEMIWYEVRDASSPPSGGTEPKNNARDKITYDHNREVLNIELLILQLEIELLKMGDTSDATLEKLKNG